MAGCTHSQPTVLARSRRPRRVATSGVRPLRPQVRRVGGDVLAPHSSAKTTHAPRVSASSFGPGPHLGAPPVDLFLVAFGGPRRGHLVGEAHPLQ
ncbi:hypothetical protein HNR07_003461 [Nocardiopsis metallicus]|uniref:Uncharacterized protein n=1 Tax=Nocardiopsis metallicus TaxID=179819 RepID=A0A840W8D2_9ACTN|nr:hypothetical protein [Nocardiopsis metallicus]